MSLSRRPASAPPRPPFVISVGITGHRSESYSAAELEALRGRVKTVFETLRSSGERLLARSGDVFSAPPIIHRLVSPIADGADQIAAEVAIELGWEVQALLPFERVRYRESLASEQARARFDGLLAAASSVLELPGNPDHPIDGYVMVGRATVAHCDILLAVWDGQPPRGRGGTGEVTLLALTGGTSVVHLSPDPATPTRLLWSAFDPTVVTSGDDPGVERDFDRANVDAMLGGLLLPPPDSQEQAFIARFFAERLRNIRARIEYPLLLNATGVRRLRIGDFTERGYADQVREEWRAFREGCGGANQVDAPIEALEDAYRWADRLATHFAQTYRSGHIFAFVLGSIAVCLGLSAFMAPAYKFEFAVGEMLITLAVIANAVVGTRNEWHRRWLDYRQLAERLRPMRSLKLLGIAAPDPPGSDTNPVARRWIDWYAGAIWRAIGAPTGSLDRHRAARLAAAIGEREVAPQVAYHRRNAHQIETLDERLEAVATGLFAATLIVSVMTLIGMATGARFVDRFGNWFTLVSAGFPALGTAVFGIRFQGDFGGDALRSLATADTLGRIDEELRRGPSLIRAADLTEQAARVMLSDLDEWRLVNQQRELEMG